MSRFVLPRSLGALCAAFALIAVLVVPAFADSGDQSSSEQSLGDQSGPPPASATSLDPCQVVTSAEASALAGTTFGAGTEQTGGTGSRICVYGYQTLNVFMVVVAQAPDADTAQADWDQELARAQELVQGNLPPGVSVNLSLSQDTGLQGYDRSASASASEAIGPQTLNISGIYLLKGPTFVSFSDLLLNQPAPTTDAMAGEAQTVLGRLP